MEIGLIGLPNAGKTTIFNALTGRAEEVTTYTDTTAKPNIAVVDVLDERITRLSEMYRPKKTTYATVQLVDLLAQLGEIQILVVVLVFLVHVQTGQHVRTK